MMTSHFEIWTEQDQHDLDAFLEALAENDLTQALLAIEGVTPERGDLVRKELAHWAEQLEKVLQRGTITHPVDALRLVLIDVLDLQGDADDYYHPKNSYLSVVVERRRGLPILLSAVWIIVSELAGIDTKGVGMPGHFIVQVGSESKQYVDPFDSGRPLTIVDCQAIVSRIYRNAMPWREQFLEPISFQGLLERVLGNLLSVFTQQEDVDSIYRTLRFFSSLCPSESDLLLKQAQIAELAGEPMLALEDYRLFQDRFPNDPELERVMKKAEQLGMRMQWIH